MKKKKKTMSLRGENLLIQVSVKNGLGQINENGYKLDKLVKNVSKVVHSGMLIYNLLYSVVF